MIIIESLHLSLLLSIGLLDIDDGPLCIPTTSSIYAQCIQVRDATFTEDGSTVSEVRHLMEEEASEKSQFCHSRTGILSSCW